MSQSFISNVNKVANDLDSLVALNAKLSPEDIEILRNLLGVDITILLEDLTKGADSAVVINALNIVDIQAIADNMAELLNVPELVQETIDELVALKKAYDDTRLEVEGLRDDVASLDTQVKEAQAELDTLPDASTGLDGQVMTVATLQDGTKIFQLKEQSAESTKVPATDTRLGGVLVEQDSDISIGATGPIDVNYKKHNKDNNAHLILFNSVAESIRQTNSRIDDTNVSIGELEENISGDIDLNKVFYGMIVPFHGTFGGVENKNPIRKKNKTDSGVVDIRWVLCDGTNDTPDLVNRFIYGSNLSDIGKSGGTAIHTHSIEGNAGNTTLSIENIPSHNHGGVISSTSVADGYGHGNNGSYGVIVSSENTGYSGHLVSSIDGIHSSWATRHVLPTSTTHAQGGGQAHTHSLEVDTQEASSLPPYYKLTYIMYIGE